MENKQRTDEWFEQRLGRFTASSISDLLGARGLGKTGETLAKKKANEIVFGRDESWDIESFDMKRGNETEPEAFEALKFILKKKHGLKLDVCEFFPYGANAGASPDGIVLESDIIAEIKCPRPDKLFNLIADGASAIDSDYYDQMQMQMLCTNSNKVFFFNYCIWNNKPLFHLLEVERDKARIELIKQRIDEAVIIRDAHVEKLRANLQFKF